MHLIRPSASNSLNCSGLVRHLIPAIRCDEEDFGSEYVANEAMQSDKDTMVRGPREKTIVVLMCAFQSSRHVL